MVNFTDGRLGGKVENKITVNRNISWPLKFHQQTRPTRLPFLASPFSRQLCESLTQSLIGWPEGLKSTKTSSFIRACELIVICLWPAYCSFLIAYCLPHELKCDQASSTEECELCLWPHWPVCFYPLFIWLLWCMNTTSNTDCTLQTFNSTIEFNIHWMQN